MIIGSLCHTSKTCHSGRKKKTMTSEKRISIRKSLFLAAGAIAAAAAVHTTSVSADTILTVSAGQTLNKIAAQTGSSVNDIAKTNNIKNVNLIFVGQRLTIPSGSSSSNNTVNATATASTYTVKPGDTLWHIAATHGLKLGELINLNNVNVNGIIYPGQVLKLSSKASSQPTSSSNNQPVTVTPAPSNAAKVASSNTQEATPVTPSAPAGSYTVKKGDTLNNISKATGVSVATLAGSNNIKNINAIYPGQILVLSSSAPATPVAPATTPAQTVAPSSVTPAPAQSSQPAAPAQVQQAPAAAPVQSQSSVTNTKPAASTAPDQAPVQSATTVTPTQKPVVPSTPATQPAASSNWESLAKSLIGTPYVWGGKTPAGFDCSGFVAYVLNHSGRTSNFPSYTVAQESVVTQIPVSQAKPGDILFWGDHGSTYHDAIYLGNNQFIDAPQPGDTVGIHQMYPSWMPSFAGRVN